VATKTKKKVTKKRTKKPAEQLTGSLTNLLMGGGSFGNDIPVPVVGMGATELWWTDRHACTIVRVSDDKKTVWTKRDKAKRVDDNGMSECQEYTFSPDDQARETMYRVAKDGRYHEGGRKDARVLRIGDRSEYHDFSY
jgi:hypothetical protein